MGLFKKHAFIVVSLLIVLLSFQNCSDVRLNRVDQQVVLASKGELCTKLPDAIDRKQKFMFIMDKSGSNNTTDSGATLRAGSTEAFWLSQQNNPNIEWSMFEFRGSQAIPYIVDASGDATFSANPADMQNALTRLRGADNGGTPYGSALTAAQALISKDIRDNPQEENLYYIFFISDGAPTDITNTNALKTAVDGIMQISYGNIFLSTAYYGPNGGQAIERLREMAKSGNGKFVDINSSGKLDFDELIVKPTADPWFIQHLFVYNLNSAFCPDGTIGMDSDADGLCDKDELELINEGFNPANRYSFNDGYSDYFHWRELKYGESLPACPVSKRVDLDFDLLTECEENYIKQGSPQPGIPRTADTTLPDSDLDGIIDGIEAMVFFTESLAYVLDPFNLKSNSDGEADDAYTQIYEHRNPLARDADHKGYDIYWRKTHVNNKGQTCYSFDQKDLTVYPTLAVQSGDAMPGLNHEAYENKILIYFLQKKQSDPSGRGVYMHSIQTLKWSKKTIGNNSLNISDGAFRSYKVPKN